MKYAVTLFVSKFMPVGDKWQSVDIERTFTFDDYDDAQNLIGYLVHGSNGSVKVEIEAIKEEKA